ncbi:MAG: DUF5074 domain-containing protein, partial [Bacteroidota bacterium]
MNLNKLLFLLIIVCLASCEKDTPDEVGKYEKGIFVINEGPFQSGNGSITYFNPDNNLASQNIFQEENEGLKLGNIAQSMTVARDMAYLLINNAGVIQIVNADDFKDQGQIEGINQPRNMIVANDSKAYVSSWGVDGFSGQVSVVNLNTNGVASNIEVGGGPESMLVVGNELYITKSGGFGRDSLLLIVNTETDLITDTIIVGDNPIGIVKDINNQIWVLSRGHSDWVDPSLSTSGRLDKIVNKEVVASFDVPNGADNLNISANGNRLFFTAAGSVISHDIDEQSYQGNSIIEQFFYALEVDPSSGNLFAADAKDFASQGEVIIFDEQGEEISRFDAGIIPKYEVC